MKNTFQRWLMIWSLVPSLSFFAIAKAQEAPQPPPQDGIEVLARGPVHEAFAEPAQENPRPTEAIRKQPPPPIKEVPPNEKPQGEDVQWIPGYWSWDLDKNDFIWVSGVWRVPPPDRKWVPGYWNKIDAGWQWVSGLWARADRDDLQYLEEPPASLDNGPSAPAPNDDSIYVPGNWVYQNQYMWRPGFWQGARPGWIWNQACYSWAPRGYVYNDGYWDYSLADRGLLFAPVYFNQPYWNTPDWFYRPYYGVNRAALLASLFTAPRWGGYYFGNYYSSFYRDRWGFRPWFDGGWGRRDSLFGYYNWAFGPRWSQGLHSSFAARMRGDLAVPPINLAGQNTLLRHHAGNNLNALKVVAPISHLNNLARRTSEFRGPPNGSSTAFHNGSQSSASFSSSRMAVPSLQGHEPARSFANQPGPGRSSPVYANRNIPEYRTMPSYLGHGASSNGRPYRGVTSSYQPQNHFSGAIQSNHASANSNRVPSQSFTPHVSTEHSSRGFSGPAPAVHNGGHSANSGHSSGGGGHPGNGGHSGSGHSSGGNSHGGGHH